MPTDHIDVNYVANLARLELTPQETETYQRQLDDILGYIHQLSELDLDGIEPTAHASPVFDRIRPDQTKPSLPQQDFLNNAPQTSGNQLKVPKVID